MKNNFLDPNLEKKAKRIAWYTKKVAEFGSVHPAKRTEKHRIRAKRLLEYKKMLNEFLMD